MFVAVHAGIRGNGRADRLTGLAIMSEDQGIDHVDIIYNLRDWRIFRSAETSAFSIHLQQVIISMNTHIIWSSDITRTDTHDV